MLPSKSKLKKISQKIRHKEVIGDDEVDAVKAWRSAHAEVLNIWQSLLRKRITRLKMKGDVKLAQRLKRYKTIIYKLNRYDMCLTNMHDIAGCRLVFKNLDDLHFFRGQILNNSKFKHVRIKSDKYNYIDNPKGDGYRGIHDVYECLSKDGVTKLKVEVQYRTLTQHIWSTTSESIGMITGGSVKFKTADKNTEEYFKVCSEIFARAKESSYSCQANLSNAKLAWKYVYYELLTGTYKTISLFKTAVKYLGNDINIKAYILTFTPNHKKNSSMANIKVERFESKSRAIHEYNERELNESPYTDMVLVTAENQKLLKHLFPNYFLAKNDFEKSLFSNLNIIADQISKSRRRFNVIAMFFDYCIVQLLKDKDAVVFISGVWRERVKGKRRK